MAKDMTLPRAWKAAKKGKAIARRSWNETRPPVRVTSYCAEDPFVLGKRLNVDENANLKDEDLDARDWYVVPDA